MGGRGGSGGDGVIYSIYSAGTLCPLPALHRSRSRSPLRGLAGNHAQDRHPRPPRPGRGSHLQSQAHRARARPASRRGAALMNAPEPILDYLKNQIPAYPFDPKLDEAFVHELIEDFHDLDILEETKTFRWYHNNRPADRFKNVRVGLRRWIANSWARKTD